MSRRYLVVTLCTAGLLALGPVSPADSAPAARASGAALFHPLSPAKLAQYQIRFLPLSKRQLASVRVTSTEAIHRAWLLADSSTPRSSAVVSVDLGGVVNDQDIIHDWDGTKSYVPPSTPTYLVTFRHVHVEAVYRGSGNAVTLMMNARTGTLSSTFIYNVH